MKLQLALDTLTLEECMTLLQETRGSVDIAEVGTPFIIEEGMRPVREFKQHFPEIEILADAKIMDAGELEAETAFKAGADIVTVLGASNDSGRCEGRKEIQWKNHDRHDRGKGFGS